ncbi:MAG: polysaccharide biosynthesis C-terminal domain-containing protein [Bacteroidales bacterium]|nr:polysaccharide biosynthesis C-terminal domain-containing protein [Bacteroidales bacterium]
MKKRFFENLSIFLALNLLVKPIYVFGIDRVVQNTVGTEIYGSYFPLLNLVLIFQIFLDLGIENFTRKEIAHNPGLTHRLFSRFIFIKVFLSLAFILVFSIAGLLLPHSGSDFFILFLLLINQAMASFILYLRANIGGMQMFKAESFISVLDRFFMILIAGALLIIPSTKSAFRIEWFVMAQTLSYFITLVISIVIFIQKAGKISLRVNILSYLPILRQLAPYALLTLLMAFYYRIDSVFLRYMLPDGREQAGIYAHGFRILDFMSNYALIFALILLPTYSRMLREKGNIAPLLRISTLSLLVPSFAFLISIVFYRKQVFEVLYFEHTALSSDTFLIFIISFAGICTSYTYGALLTANGNLRQLNIMAFTAVLLSIVLNLILVPKYKVLGAAATNAITQAYTIAFHILAVKRQFGLKTDKLLVIKLTAFVLFSLLVAYTLSKSGIIWYLGVLFATLVSLLFSVALKLISFENALGLFKGKVTEQ